MLVKLNKSNVIKKKILKKHDTFEQGTFVLTWNICVSKLLNFPRNFKLHFTIYALYLNILVSIRSCVLRIIKKIWNVTEGIKHTLQEITLFNHGHIIYLYKKNSL